MVSSCSGYGKYLKEWAESIAGLNTKPARVCLVTHGIPTEEAQGKQAVAIINAAGVEALHKHVPERLDFGVARNMAVAMSETEWVMHFDCDDTLMPHAMEDIAALAPQADVVALGYERSGDLAAGPSNKRRIYSSTTGLQALDAAAPCSGVSPFRRSLWERSPYRTDMKGAWDTALWIGFARLGARFRATKRPCFWYRQHADSIFNKRRTTVDWTHVYTGSYLRALRRGDRGVGVIVPLDANLPEDRRTLWSFVKNHYSTHHPDWPVVEGVTSEALWCKGDAIAKALAQTTADILVIADADCIVPPEALAWAVDAVEKGAPWAVPHHLVHRLSEAVTRNYLSGVPLSLPLNPKEYSRPPYAGYPGGGILVVRRRIYEAVGGIPLGFKGWGSEDQCLALLLDTLAGEHVRGTADLIHLYHAPQPTRKTPEANSRLFRKIKAAAHKGPDYLLSTLPNLPKAPSRKTLWQKKVDEQANRFDLEARRNRNSFLARRNRGTGGVR